LRDIEDRKLHGMVRLELWKWFDAVHDVPAYRYPINPPFSDQDKAIAFKYPFKNLDSKTLD